MDVHQLDTADFVALHIRVALFSRRTDYSFGKNVSIGYALSIPIGLFGVPGKTLASIIVEGSCAANSGTVAESGGREVHRQPQMPQLA